MGDCLGQVKAQYREKVRQNDANWKSDDIELQPRNSKAGGSPKLFMLLPRGGAALAGNQQYPPAFLRISL